MGVLHILEMNIKIVPRKKVSFSGLPAHYITSQVYFTAEVHVLPRVKTLVSFKFSPNFRSDWLQHVSLNSKRLCVCGSNTASDGTKTY